MKLIIQIPCFNEAAALPATLADLPRVVEGFDTVEWLVIDDGSTDDTSGVARLLGVDHVIRLPQNSGLAHAFAAGLDAAVERGADVIVNTDADNQYCAADLPALTTPILKGVADIVIGARPIDSIAHFSPVKKILQRFGSFITRSLSRTDVQDAPSGYRAFSREAARKLNVFSSYTYTLETIIQAGQNGMAVVSVPVRVNGVTRPSRLVKSIPSYVKRSMLTMLHIFVVYRPMTFFFTVGGLVGGAGLLLGLRFFYFFLIGEGGGHVQSVILSALLLGSGLLLWVLALVADLIAVNRRLLEQANWRIGRLEDQLRSAMPTDAASPRAHQPE
ncbi:glycosyltransferase family 2 protein [Synoicihabitans lomoniglobus]|uniref:Glycosyltransferase family 2 protein n=1 Tax=Synoicihabitans lomoniglobus TaxID=2909285 RepID=A0AAE9ZY02_9BACT|nr:glycosyltransferase family 2 protein [Opitutaceae bacterium LMO-M01]WED63253.1 glycosyltransferase family 2 protein [Opitutaceae bacterium LMO-M01]